MTDHVVVQTSDGAEYGYADAQTARRMRPDGVIVRYQDGRVFDVGEVQDMDPDIKGMNRDELNAYAERLGIENAESYPNKSALVDAIEAAG